MKKVIKLQIEKLLWNSASIVPVPTSSVIPRNIGTQNGYKAKLKFLIRKLIQFNSFVPISMATSLEPIALFQNCQWH
jgi:hypothetical protein